MTPFRFLSVYIPCTVGIVFHVVCWKKGEGGPGAREASGGWFVFLNRLKKRYAGL
jgi:hypothetical protein